MYGNIVNNSQILELLDLKIININPFVRKKLQTVHYPLNINLIIEYDDRGDLSRITQLKKGKSYSLAANGYVVVEIDEKIFLEPGIIGEFVNSSNLIEKGLFLTCGKLDPNYGKKGESIRFGLKNLRDKEVVIEYDLKLAYIKFYDLRALSNLDYDMTTAERKIWISRIRKAQDDGVNYDEE